MRNRADHQVTLVLIRHGATMANKEHRYLGRTDEGLSEEGIKELLSYKRQGIYPNVCRLFTSPMRRCLETARVLYPGLCSTVIPEWEETDFGQFEYKNYEELKEDPAYQAWIDSGGALPFPDGESREEFIARCERGFLRMCNELCRKEAVAADISTSAGVLAVPAAKVMEAADAPLTVGIIVHGGTIMALLSKHCGGDYYDYHVGNGRGYICSMNEWGAGAQALTGGEKERI